MAHSQEDPDLAVELLIPEEPKAPEEENREAGEMLRSSPVPLRPSPAEELPTTVTPAADLSGATEVELEPDRIEAPQAIPAPAFRGSPVAGDTALMRVTDHSAEAISRLSYAPAFRTGPLAPPVSLRPGAMRLGPVSLRASLSAGVFGEKDSSLSGGENGGWETVFRASPSVTGVLGHPEAERFLTFDYAASLQSGGRQEETFDQALSINAFYGFAKLKLQAGVDYSLSTGADRDLGASTDRTQFGASFNADYALSVKSALQATVSTVHSSYSDGIDSEQIDGSLFFDRQMSLKTRLGLGATMGALSVASGEDQTFEQVHLRATYSPTLKLAFSASTGYEFRQIGGENSATPIFSGGVSYQIRPRTALNLSASRSVSSSAAQRNTNYTSTTVTFGVSQQIGYRVSANLALGYQHASYEESEDAGNGFGAREDHYFFVRPTVAWQVAENLSLSLFYSLGENRSNVRSFQTQQLGLNGTVVF